MKKHFWYYSITAFLQGIGLILVVLSVGYPQVQMTVVTLMAMIYVMWGIIHHLLHHNLHTKIVLEYVLVAVLSISLVFFLLQ